jgi:tRNA (guanine-N7-)-methyltransferase
MNAEGEAQHVSSEAQAAPLERNVASAASTVSGSGVPDSPAFVKDRALYAELGCGKGRFIAEMAQRHPEDLFLGIEGHQGVLLRAGQKLMEQQTGNARLLCAYVHDIRDFFAEGELDGLYLNFSDPWPKARHEKRRLTHRAYLASYRDVVKKGGFLAFKTDNDGLFEFTLEEIAAEGYDILEMSRDLHNSAYAADNVMTEYEARFSENGKTINYVKIAL